MSVEWIEVDPVDLADTRTRNVNGVRITFMPSPYDLPDAFRGYYDKALNCFVIEFQYLADEKTENEEHGPYVTLRVGKNSGRVYGIEVDVNAAKAQWVELIQKALHERSQEARKPQRPANYEATRKLIKERVPELVAV